MQSVDICMFGNQLAPSSGSVYIGGSVNTAIQLSESLADEGHNIHIVTIAPRNWDSERPDDVELPDWARHRIFDATAQHPGLLDGVQTFYDSARELLSYCRSHEIDVIHSHSGFSVLASVAAAVGGILDIPVVHTLYCPIPEEKLNRIDKKLSSPLPARLTLNSVGHVFAMTRNVESSLQRHGVEPTTFVPPIIDTETYRPDLAKPTSVELADDKPTVLFVGNLHPTKGIRHLVRALGELRAEGRDFQAIVTTERHIPGQNERREEVWSMLEQEGLADDTEMLGIIDDMPNLLANADVIAMPFTTTDGPSDYPIALLEGMACDTTAVGSNVGGIPELLGDGRGVLVPPGNGSALANGIADALDGEGYETRSFIKERFSPDAVTSTVVETYRRLLGQPMAASTSRQSVSTD
ncbi:glycosyltransferase [Haloarcula argentinensis]|uniref:Glycosyltransferase n=2 Tax=Haloarcula argentinensis TaxID=43776 RepID=A0A847UAL2_HALAR|nr:glycosyltransferase [Haloarcula argentinensis]